MCLYCGVPILPNTDDSLLLRTAFADKAAWIGAMSAATSPDEDGFRAYVRVVDDKGWDASVGRICGKRWLPPRAKPLFSLLWTI